ncbi:MAG: sugar phosphate isomerase/epimerase [Bacteroidetes bacterium]|nr:MAG: sugar phosphate isomerase/epimerase [Bacteroidota bacterium]
MNYNRRHFLRNGVAAGLSFGLLPQWLLSCKSAPEKPQEESAASSPSAGMKYIDHIGVQLYTVRDQFAANPTETLAALAQIGFKEIELHDAGLLPDYAPAIEELGMKVTSSHFSPAFITGRWDLIEQFGGSKPDYEFAHLIELAAKHHLPYLLMPMLFPEERGNLDHYKALAATFNEYGRQCKEAGVQFGYHNHNFEFQPQGDSTPFEVLISETDPELVALELDVFWVKAAGLDPVNVMKQHAHRIRLLHLKDLQAGTPPTYKTIETSARFPEIFVELGKGSIDFAAVLTTAAEIGVTNCYVEQDHSADPLKSLQTSYQYLTRLGL